MTGSIVSDRSCVERPSCLATSRAISGVIAARLGIAGSAGCFGLHIAATDDITVNASSAHRRPLPIAIRPSRRRAVPKKHAVLWTQWFTQLEPFHERLATRL